MALKMILELLFLEVALIIVIREQRGITRMDKKIDQILSRLQ